MTTPTTYHYSDAENERLIEMWNQGVGLKEIATRLGRSYESVRGRTKRLREQGVIVTRSRRREDLLTLAAPIAERSQAPVEFVVTLLREYGNDSESVERLARQWTAQQGKCWYLGTRLDPDGDSVRRAVLEWFGPSPRLVAQFMVQFRQGLSPTQFLRLCHRITQRHPIVPPETPPSD